MATREENIKKINDELEKLSDEELEQVAGGDCDQTDDFKWYNNVHNTYSLNSRKISQEMAETGWK